MKNYHGITARLHLIDLRPTELPKEHYERCKKEPQQYCYSQDWMKNGGLILWNAIAICDMSKTSWRMEKLPSKGDSENHSRDRSFHLEQWSSIIRLQQEIHPDRILGVFLGYALIAGRIWKRRSSDCKSRRIGNNGRIRNLSTTTSHDLTKGRRICIFNSRWYSKNVRKRLRIPRTHSKAGTHRME